MEEEKKEEVIGEEKVAEKPVVSTTSTEKNNKKNKLVLIIVIVTIVAIGAGVGGYFLFFGGKDTNSGNGTSTKVPDDKPSKIEKGELVCKRAKKLHTATCTAWIQPDNYTASTVPIEGCRRYENGAPLYEFGETITYGNLGTPGEYNIGDAFDCDVNNDGVFDDETERFYLLRKFDKGYISTISLIYYSNVSNGEPNNTQFYVYNENISDTEYLGPQTALKQLPSSSQWTNKWLNFFTYEHLTKLIKSTSDTGVIINYGDKKARLLKAEDMDQCLDDSRIEKKKSAFLFENTNYSNINLDIDTAYWMENVYYSVRDDYSFAYALTAGGDGLNIWDNLVNNTNLHFGVRPVIEIYESHIEE